MEANASGMICAKCGTPNAAGDAFCGSCGAFLEFAAEETGAHEVAAAEREAAPVAPEPVAPAPVAPSPAPPSPAPPTSAAPTPAPTPPTSAPPTPAPLQTAVPPAPSLLATTGPTCPVCRRANPAGRTFCISCGERLPAAGRPVATSARAAAPTPAVAPPPATPRALPARALPPAPAPAAPTAAPAAALAPTAPPAPTGPTWEFPSTPVRQVATPMTKPGAPAPAGRRGRSPLPLIVGAGVLFLVLAGGGAAILLGGGGSQATPTPGAPGATAAASGALPTESTPNSSASASEPEPSSAPEPSATAMPAASAPATLPPGPAIGLKLSSATASSSLAKRPASAAIDGDPTTTWKTGTPSPADQWLQVTFAPAAVTRVQLWIGWQRTKDFYAGNHRPHNVTIRFDDETAIPLELKDVYGSQRVDIPPELGIVGVTRLRITILDWYPAKKTPAAGSPTTQAAISEIRLYGIPVTQ